MPVVARLQIIIVTVVLMMAAAAIDTPAAEREKLLTDPGVFVTFAAFRLDEDWSKLDRGGRTSAAATAKEAIQRHTADAAIDAYLLRGLSDHADVLLRVHASELQTNQQVILDLLASSLGRHLTPVYVFNGLTKKANYAPAFPDEMKTALKATPEPGAKRYAIVIPIRKDAAWWLLDKETRTGMMKEHTEASLPYLKTVTRKLYHSTGLDDFDFITYFETSNLADFQSLVLGLQQVKENQHNRRFGSPTLLGTIHSMDETFDALAGGQ